MGRTAPSDKMRCLHPRSACAPKLCAPTSHSHVCRSPTSPPPQCLTTSIPTVVKRRRQIQLRQAHADRRGVNLHVLHNFHDLGPFDIEIYRKKLKEIRAGKAGTHETCMWTSLTLPCRVCTSANDAGPPTANAYEDP
eukprot:4399503-Pleurochrysis_carterae.AAC.3